jgi:thiamine-monophosphate kinase
MLDVSDGLAADLGHVAAASGVRVDLDLDALRALATDGVTDDDILTGGDDHALVATVPPEITVPEGVVVIGVVTDGSGVHAGGRAIFGGHDHFGATAPS